MGDNSQDTMGENSTDPMDVSAGEETESEYFSEVANFDVNLDHSMDSLQGSFNLPVFFLEQSTALQGSQGFQLSAAQKTQLMSQSRGSDDMKLEYITDTYGQQQTVYRQVPQTIMHPAFRDDGKVGSCASNLSQNPGLSSTNSAFITPANFNIVSMPDQPFMSQGSAFSSALSYTFSGDKLSSMVKTGVSVQGDIGDGEEEDKAGAFETGDTGNRNKSSPKGKGRKSRSTSSSSADAMPKSEAQVGGVPVKVEVPDPSSGEMSFKPSLLDEILTEKKLALLKTPEVMRFLQSQQENVLREKAYTTRQTMDS